MDMGAAAGAFKKPGNEDFVFFEDFAADRANAVPVSVEAVDAAPYMHEPVFAAVQGRKGQGADQFPLFQFG